MPAVNLAVNMRFKKSVNSLYNRHCRDLELVSSLAGVRSRVYFSQTAIFGGDLAAVRIIGVSARQEFTVTDCPILKHLAPPKNHPGEGENRGKQDSSNSNQGK